MSSLHPGSHSGSRLGSHPGRRWRAAGAAVVLLALAGCVAYAPSPYLAYGYGAYPYYPSYGGYPAYAAEPYAGFGEWGFGWPMFGGFWGGGCCYGGYGGYGGYGRYGGGFGGGGFGGGFHGGGMGMGMGGWRR